jgi:hypothetical protein
MSQRSASFPATRPRIVIIYHRGDAEAQAQRLIQALKGRFGDGVKTCYDLPPSELISAGGPTVLVVLVGKKWPRPAKGRRPDPDAARAGETLASALSSALEIIPVLVGGASMPEGTSISHLSSQWLRLRDARWEQDVETLSARIERSHAPPSKGQHAPDYSVIVNLRRDDAIKLLYALMIYLGGAPEEYSRVKKRGSKSIAIGGDVSGSKIITGDDIEELTGGDPTYWEENPADVVSCSVFSPPQVSPGATFLVQVYAHLPEDAGQASQLAKEAVKESEKLGSKTLDSEVERGTKLGFDLSLPSLLIDEPSQHLVWRGRPEAVKFGVTVPATQQPGNVIGTVRVSQDGVPFGHVKFQLTVAAVGAAAPAPQPQPTRNWVQYKKAFVSYASKDRPEVLKRAQMLARLVPDFFVDFMKLEPGERWEKGLYKQIDESDAFFLFWSTAAKQSKWVMKEVDYALARKGADESGPPEIIPMVIEGPPPVKPPRRLSHLHFNDLFLYAMAQPQAKAGAKKKGRPRKRRQP